MLAASTLNVPARYVACFIFAMGSYSVNSVIIGWASSTLSQTKEKKAVSSCWPRQIRTRGGVADSRTGGSRHDKRRRPDRLHLRRVPLAQDGLAALCRRFWSFSWLRLRVGLLRVGDQGHAHPGEQANRGQQCQPRQLVWILGSSSPAGRSPRKTCCGLEWGSQRMMHAGRRLCGVAIQKWRSSGTGGVANQSQNIRIGTCIDSANEPSAALTSSEVVQARQGVRDDGCTWMNEDSGSWLPGRVPSPSEGRDRSRVPAKVAACCGNGRCG